MTLSYTEFCAEAQTVLPALVSPVLSRAESGDLPRGRWHPYGFAVYKVGEVAALGTVRLHIWSSGVRVAKKGHPPVHEHEWHLASLVVAGQYRDELHDVLPARRQADAEVYAIATSADGRDCFRATGEEVQVRSCGVTNYGPGEFHYIPAGVYHASPVPDATFAATLVVTSPPTQDRRSIVGHLSATDQAYERPGVSLRDHRRLIEELRERTT